jgi:hypothetical protein
LTGYEFIFLQNLNMPTALGLNVNAVITLERNDNIISMVGKFRLIIECYK